MRFWDTSALVPLLAEEPGSATARALLREDPSLCIWWAARTECLSGLQRRLRERKLTRGGFETARRRLLDLEAAATVVQPSEAVRERAERLLAVHALRAADAFHVAAALLAASDRPGEISFVTLDERQSEAAEREGFTVLPRSSV